MRMNLKVEWQLDWAGWAAAIAACPDATYFHTPGWLKAVGSAFDTRLLPIRFELGDGRWALLPLSVRPLAKGLVPVATAGEIGAYGGLVGPQALSEVEAAAIFRTVRQRFANLNVTGNPFTTCPHLGLTLPGTVRQDQSTHLLELAPLETLRQGFSRGCKARGNKARKQGFTVEVTREPEAIAAYYALYLDSVRRWGDKLTWIRPRAFFEQVLAQNDGHARLFLARQDGRAVSGLLFAAYGPAAHYLAGATEADALAGCPSNLLMEEALSFYQRSGYRWFDFGPSNGLEGVIQFKESFGAHPVPFQSTQDTSATGRMYASLRGLIKAVGPKPPASAVPAPVAG